MHIAGEIFKYKLLKNQKRGVQPLQQNSSYKNLTGINRFIEMSIQNFI